MIKRPEYFSDLVLYVDNLEAEVERLTYTLHQERRDRPEWTQGFTSASVVAQVLSGALYALGDLLGDRCSQTIGGATVDFLRLEHFRRRALLDPKYRGELWILTLEVEEAVCYANKY